MARIYNTPSLKNNNSMLATIQSTGAGPEGGAAGSRPPLKLEKI